MTPNGYIAFVESEPIIGIPSRRTYGPYSTSAEAWDALMEAKIVYRMLSQTNLAPGWSGAGVLPIRPIETLMDEQP